MLSESALAEAIFWACKQEVMAPKPGNVNVLSNGHGMEVKDFLDSAEVIAPILAMRKLSVGEKILKAVTATQAKVGTNTNLGIILLLSPICQAISLCKDFTDLPKALNNTLTTLTVTDAKNCYEAIRRANAGGLGNVDEQDIREEPNISLLAAMQLAESYDRIAYQYSHNYVDIWKITLPTLFLEVKNGKTIEWAITLAYLSLLSKVPDSLICRKQSKEVALSVTKTAESMMTHLSNNNNLSDFEDKVTQWDTKLKQKGVNPGTSADIIAATLLLYKIQQNN